MTDAKQQIRLWCRDADASMFRCFYREQAGKLWRFLIARGCDRDSAYDVVAEAFLRFIQNVCHDPSEPVALLYRIAVNLRIDSYRREQASPTVAVPDLEGLQTAVPSEPDDHGQLRSAINTLPEAEQYLVLLRYWVGMSHKEVAQALDMPEGTVRRRCTEVMERLRGMLGER